MLLLPATFLLIGNAMLDVANLAEKTQKRRWRALFGTSALVMSQLWNRLTQQNRLPPKGRPKHLLWMCVFLKVYRSEAVHCKLVGVRDEKTYRKWVWLFIDASESIMPSLVDFNSRLPNNWQNARFKCWMSVDGTDFKVHEPVPFDRTYLSHKYNHAGLRYEIGIAFNSGLICWVNGPWKAGSYTDLVIFQQTLRQQLTPGEKVIADGTYNDPRCIRKNEYDHPLVKQWKREIRARHETCNRRFKQYNCLAAEWHHNRNKHGRMFKAVVTLVQLSLMNGEPLFEVEFG